MIMQQNHNRKYILITLVAGISMVHFFPLPGWMGTHLLHREIYFFPILLAGFWYGARGGLTAAIGIGIIYTTKFVVSDLFLDVKAAVGLQVAVFVSMGLFFGWMVDRQHRRQKERDKIHDAFGRYVPREVRDEILSGRISLEGEYKTVTVLFADIRNFSGLVKDYDPRTVVRIMNRYFKEMTEAIRDSGGLVLQFVGDEIEAIFGAPVSTQQHARMALQAATAMRLRLKLLNQELHKEGLPLLSHGIGIHTGTVLAGNIGSPDRLSYAMVGTTVNLASRIQEVNKTFGTDILLTVDTRAACGEGFKLIKVQRVMVKGFSAPIELYRLDKEHPDDQHPLKGECPTPSDLLGNNLQGNTCCRQSLPHVVLS